jgi:predicted Zn finger-like uncharacterized protein
MRAVCPSCEAVYEIPDRLIGTGRRLRCTKCSHEWTLLPAVAEAPETVASMAERSSSAALESVSEAEPPRSSPSSALARPMLRRPPQVIDPPLPAVADDGAGFQHGRAALLAAWVGSVLLVVVALGALWTFRYEIATAWPPAARLTGTPVGGG